MRSGENSKHLSKKAAVASAKLALQTNKPEQVQGVCGCLVGGVSEDETGLDRQPM